MTHQDYISRSKAKNKKNNPYKKGADNASAGMPIKVKLIGLFTLIAIAGFTYFLWSIKDNTSTELATPQKTVTTKSGQTLPSPPEEKWAYVKELENKEVEVGEYEVTNKGPYKMQCGSFKTYEQADVLKAQIAFTGLEAQISAAKGSTGTWYKVFLGPYPRKRLAEKDKHKLKNNNVNHCQIWLWK